MAQQTQGVDEPVTLTCGADTFISITYHEV